MKQETLSKIEKEALFVGGEAGGAYLDHIGKSDLATLTGEEWFEFLRIVRSATNCEHVRLLQDHAAPF